jgi:hypothetical protein
MFIPANGPTGVRLEEGKNLINILIWDKTSNNVVDRCRVKFGRWTDYQPTFDE